MAMQEDDEERDKLGKVLDRMDAGHPRSTSAEGGGMDPATMIPETLHGEERVTENGGAMDDGNNLFGDEPDGIPEGREEDVDGAEEEAVEEEDSDEEMMDAIPELLVAAQEIAYEATSPASSRASSGTPHIEPKRRRGEESPTESMLSFERLIGHIDAKVMLEELEQDPRLKLVTGNRRQRRTAAQTLAKGVVA